MSDVVTLVFGATHATRVPTNVQVRNKNSIPEVEIRFHTSVVKREDGSTVKRTALHQGLWRKIGAALFDSNFIDASKIQVVKDRVVLHNSYRHIINLTDPTVPDIYQYKSQTRPSTDFMSIPLSMPGGPNAPPVDMTVSASIHFNTETTLTRVPQTGVDETDMLVRTRTRVRFPGLPYAGSPDPLYIIDMTYAEGDPDSPATTEMEIEFVQPAKSRDDVVALLNFVEDLIKSNAIVRGIETTSVVYETSLSNMLRLLGENNRNNVAARPVDVDKDGVYPSTYAVSPKLNGVHGFLYIVDKRCVLLSDDGVVRPAIMLPDGAEHIGTTVIEVETYTNPDTAAVSQNAFDLLYSTAVKYPQSESGYVRSGDWRKFGYNVRYDALQKVVNMTAGAVVVKQALFPDARTSIQDLIARTYEFIGRGEDNTYDGMIFTDTRAQYSQKMPVFKWKPARQLTIDFRVRRVRDEPVLFAGSGADAVAFVDDETGKPVPVYDPSGVFQFYPAALDFVVSNGATTILGNDQVFEFAFVDGAFRAERPRPDKTRPNSLKTAQNVWKLIKNPLSIEELSEKMSSGRATVFVPPAEPFPDVRSAHNFVKKQLIARHCNNANVVVDVGYGRGGDMHKYIDANVSKVYGIDPSKENLAEAAKRFADRVSKKLTGTTAIVTHHGDLQSFLASNAFRQMRSDVDVLSMFFSLSFFFDTQKSLLDLVRGIATVSPRTFIGTTIDGEATRAFLRGAQFEQKKDVGDIRIVKKYKDFDGDIGFHKTIAFQYENSATVADVQLESLVDFQLFVDMMAEVGYLLDESEYITNIPFEKQVDANASALYRSFVFVKSTAPKTDDDDKVVTKLVNPLVQMMDGNFLYRVPRDGATADTMIRRMLSVLMERAEEKIVWTDVKAPILRQCMPIRGYIEWYVAERQNRGKKPEGIAGILKDLATMFENYADDTVATIATAVQALSRAKKYDKYLEEIQNDATVAAYFKAIRPFLASKPNGYRAIFAQHVLPSHMLVIEKPDTGMYEHLRYDIDTDEITVDTRTRLDARAGEPYRHVIVADDGYYDIVVRADV